MSFSKEDFKKTLGQFATGVTIVTTLGEKKEPVGMTVNSLTSVSLEPPLILFCVHKDARLAKVFVEAEYFAVNILTVDQRALSNAFARREKDCWERAPWVLSEAYPLPYFRDTQACIFARHYQIYDGGDHHIILGEVLDLVRNDEQAPLLYFQGQYTHL